MNITTTSISTSKENSVQKFTTSNFTESVVVNSDSVFAEGETTGSGKAGGSSSGSSSTATIAKKRKTENNKLAAAANSDDINK